MSMNIQLSKKAQQVSPSITLAIDSKAKQMKADGINVISFGVGEPDFATPENIKNAAIEAINKGFTTYTPASGLPQLKQAICVFTASVFQTRYLSSATEASKTARYGRTVKPCLIMWRCLSIQAGSYHPACQTALSI